MRHLFVWTGPVQAQNVARVRWSAPTDVIVIGTGIGDSNPIGSTAFSNLGSSTPSPKLANLVRGKGKDINDYDAVCLGSFSAGHGLCNVLFKDAPTLERVDGFLAADSYYGLGIKQGYWAMAQKAAEGDAIMWLTTSNGRDPNVGTSEEGFRPFAAALGMERVQLGAPLAELLKPVEYVEEKGRCVHAHWGDAYSHVNHALIVGPAVLERVISPWLVTREPLDSGVSGWKAAMGLAGVAVGIAAAAFAAKKLKER